MLGDLKWEHRIYKEDFESKEEFRNIIEGLLEELKERKNNLTRKEDKDRDDWDNNRAREEYDETLEKAINEIEKTINKLKELKRRLR